ncbi:MAG: hypothetical protein ACN6OV_02635 [Acinetobacter sp.]|uniref:hypothetical protein n=1 Tax=Acinetobacter sp. TaxID=472 RepID=UPI003CFC1918
MVQLIKKGGLRERANRSRSYQGSENTESTLKPNRYHEHMKNTKTTSSTMIKDQDSSNTEPAPTDKK